MLIFILANLPLPLIAYLNIRVTLRFWRVRQLSKNVSIARPRRFLVGWWLSNFAIIFILIPPLVERRFFVQDYRWLSSYAAAASLTIGGLLLMNSALGEELKQLTRFRPLRRAPKPVDTKASDTL